MNSLAAVSKYDPLATEVKFTSKYSALYQLGGAGKTWEATSFQGALYIYERSSAPKYQMLIINQKTPTNWTEAVVPDMRFEMQDKYLFAKCNKGIFGLWFDDVKECQGAHKVLLQIVRSVDGHAPDPFKLLQSQLVGQSAALPAMPVAVSNVHSSDSLESKLTGKHSRKTAPTVNVNGTAAHDASRTPDRVAASSAPAASSPALLAPAAFAPSSSPVNQISKNAKSPIVVTSKSTLPASASPAMSLADFRERLIQVLQNDQDDSITRLLYEKIVLSPPRAARP